jgi:hypothetical protein
VESRKGSLWHRGSRAEEFFSAVDPTPQRSRSKSTALDALAGKVVEKFAVTIEMTRQLGISTFGF